MPTPRKRAAHIALIHRSRSQPRIPLTTCFAPDVLPRVISDDVPVCLLGLSGSPLVGPSSGLGCEVSVMLTLPPETSLGSDDEAKVILGIAEQATASRTSVTRSLLRIICMRCLLPPRLAVKETPCGPARSEVS